MSECGECTLCCLLLSIPWMDSAEGELCQHCSPGIGCNIFADAPEKCKEFECLWKQSPVMGEDLRPDNCGIVFEAYHEEQTVVALVDGHKPDAWTKGEPKKLISMMLMDGYLVWILIGEERNLLLPEGKTEKQAIAQAEKAWKRRML